MLKGGRYIDMSDRSQDGIHLARSECNTELDVMMFEDIVAAMYAIAPAVSTPKIPQVSYGARGASAASLRATSSVLG